MPSTPLSMWLPGEVAQAVVDEQHGVKEAERVYGDFAKRLRAIDSRFRLYLHTGDGHFADHDMRPGFYYLLRANEDGSWASFEVRNPDGSFREPDEAVLEAVRRMDPNRVRDPRWEREKRRREAKRRSEVKAAQDAHNRQERLRELADHRFRLQVPVSDAMAALKGKKDAA